MSWWAAVKAWWVRQGTPERCPVELDSRSLCEWWPPPYQPSRIVHHRESVQGMWPAVVEVTYVGTETMIVSRTQTHAELPARGIRIREDE